MNYQIGGNPNQSGYDNTMFGNTGFGGTDAIGGQGMNGQKNSMSGILNGSGIGDLLACKLVKGGKEPVLEVNGIQIQTKAVKELEGAQPGDTIYLQIQSTKNKQVSLKIVGTQPQEQVAPTLEAVTSAQVMQSNEQYSDMIKENLDGAADDNQAKENQKEILRNLTSEEISKLRMMQIDVTNATLSDLMGMVITMRTSEHQDVVNERIGDVVRETIGKLRRSVMAGTEPERPVTDDGIGAVSENLTGVTTGSASDAVAGEGARAVSENLSGERTGYASDAVAGEGARAVSENLSGERTGSASDAGAETVSDADARNTSADNLQDITGVGKSDVLTENSNSKNTMSELFPETTMEEQNPFPGGARLNSEGYLVSAESVKAAEQKEDGNAAEQGATNAQAGERQMADATTQNERITAGDKPIITTEQMIYMVKNHMDLTVENYDIAKNSVNEGSPAKEIPFNSQVWNDIYPQVTGIIEAAGMSVTEQSISGAKFMLNHELPITVDSLRLYMSVNFLNQRGIQVAQVEENIQEQVALGNPPEQARIGGRTIRERASQLMEKVQGITPQAIDRAVTQGKPITISYLYNSSMRSDVGRVQRPVNKGAEGASLSLSGMTPAGMQNGGMPLSNHPGAVTARRQLEEIRLAMTMEAATRLIKMDINIDAKPLSQIVDALRQQENRYYDNVVSAHDLHDIPEDVDLLKESLKQTEGLKQLPEYTLGEMVKRPSITVGVLYETGTGIKAALAGNAYETMMTRPRKDMGDSITDAFRNIDDILNDLNMDRNEENQRAIRILAYNEMELNKQNILSVKSADAKVQQMFETLTPQIILNLIREGKNPLNMTIDGLNEEIMQQREVRGVTDEQRFSEFLYQMDRQNAITEEERKSFIGIYRLLDKVEKSHGKDIGAVVRNGQEVTLNNLFSADKSRKVRGMNVAVDDTFGERVNVETSGEGILEQIETAYNRTLNSSILRHIRPETLKSLEGMDYRNMSFEELNVIIKTGDNGAGQSELVEQLSQDLQQALNYEEEVSTMLEANDMPKTVTNLLATYQVMYGEDGIYGMIRNMKSSLPREKREKITQLESRMLDTLESKEDVVYGMENIRAGLSEAIHEKEADGTITAMDIQALKYMNAGMPIAMRAVSENVFRIPLVVGDEVSVMKVSIIQDGSNAGEVTASMDTKHYGRLEAFIRVTGSQLEGYVIAEEEAGQRKLEDNELTIRSVFARMGMGVKDVRLDGSRPMQYASETEKEEVSTSKLYKVAKHLLTAIKLTGIVADN